MTVLRGFIITLYSGLGFGIFGALLGFAIGSFAPDYYQVMFRMSHQIMDPARFGLVLGLTQGLSAGIFIGLIIVLTVAWFNSRIEKDPSSRIENGSS